MADSIFMVMQKGADVIQVEVTPDGVIKYTTNQISGANHASAESFRRALAGRMGKQPNTQRRHDVGMGRKMQTHTHSHEGNG